MIDVAIVGAGPAGAVAAMRLARRGAKVVLLEKESLPRNKSCSGILYHRARRQLESEFTLSVAPMVLKEIFSTRITLLRDNHSAAAARPVAPFSIVERNRFDRFLVQTATDNGATLFSPFKVDTIDRSGKGIRLSGPSGHIDATHVILADGANSPLTELAGWNPNSAMVAALHCVVMLPYQSWQRFGDVATINFDLPDNGIAVLSPTGYNTLNVTLFALGGRQNHRQLQTMLSELLKQLELPMPAQIEQHSIPVSPVKGGLARDGIYLIGDAAGLVDPLIGEGLSAAIGSALLAADSIADHLQDPGAATADYQQKMEQSWLADLALSKRAASLLYASDTLRRWIIRNHSGPFLNVSLDIALGTKTYRDLHSWIIQRVLNKLPAPLRMVVEKVL